MPALIALSFILQLFCIVHVIQTGRDKYWIFIIIIGSFLGSLAYLLTQVVPDIGRDPMTRKTVNKLKQAIDPEREKRRIADRLELADTVDNRVKLAKECLALGDYLNAEELFGSCLKGVHANDPDMMLGIARAQFGRADAAAARKTLDALIAANPDFESGDGHLLYARCLESLGDNDAALHEYAALATSYAGEEARGRYALLLKRTGHAGEAQTVFKQILARAKVAPKYYRQTQREWIVLAEEQLKTTA